METEMGADPELPFSDADSDDDSSETEPDEKSLEWLLSRIQPGGPLPKSPAITRMITEGRDVTDMAGAAALLCARDGMGPLEALSFLYGASAAFPATALPTIIAANAHLFSPAPNSGWMKLQARLPDGPSVLAMR